MMGYVIAAIIVILAAAVWAIAPLVRQKRWPEAVTCGVILLLALAIIIMDSVTWNPLRVSRMVELIFRPYASFINDLVGRI